jgi:hypothetical protein
MTGSAASRHSAVLLLFVFLTFLLVFPAAISIGSAVPGWEGDNLYYVRSMWWMKHALVDLHVLPFFDPTSYFPVGHHLARSEMSAANTIPALPITMAWGPVAAYDIAVLFSFVATGFFTYLWVLKLTGKRSPAVLAGTIMAFLPMRFAHLPGHLPQLTTQWVPLTLYAFERFLDRRTAGRAAVMGLSAALVVLGCWYYGYALAIMMPIYVALRTWPTRSLWREAAWWRGIGLAAALAIVLVAPFLVPMFRLMGQGQLHRPLAEMESWSINYYDFFLPNLLHPAWGEAASRWFPRQRAAWVERGIVLGYVAFAIALVGVLFGRPRRIVWALGGVWLASYLIALGPTLHSGDAQVRIPVGHWGIAIANRAAAALGAGNAALLQGTADGRVPVPLPSLLMYAFVPVTSSIRVMARFALWTGMMTAALAAFGLLVLCDRGERRWGGAARGAWPAALVAAVAFESLGVLMVTPVGPRAVDKWVAGQPSSVVITELPVEQGLRPFQNYWATVHGHPTLFGWNGDSFPPPEQEQRAQALRSFPSPESIDYLRSARVTYVLVNPAETPQWDAMRQRLERADGLYWERTLGGIRVYRVLR